MESKRSRSCSTGNGGIVVSKIYKIIIYDQLKNVKARVRLRVNMKIEDIQQEIKKLFASREESASVAEKSAV